MAEATKGKKEPKKAEKVEEAPEVGVEAPKVEKELPKAFDENTDEDLARGYRVGSWKGLPNFEAVDGSMATLDRVEIEAHVKRRGLTK